MTIINGIRIKDRPVHNLPVNKELQGYARKNRKAGNLAEIVFWLQVHGNPSTGWILTGRRLSETILLTFM